MNTETAWLIERGADGSPVYWNGSGWTDDSLEAIRYARQLDAEREILLSQRLAGSKALEHMWHMPDPLDDGYERYKADSKVCERCHRRSCAAAALTHAWARGAHASRAAREAAREISHLALIDCHANARDWRAIALGMRGTLENALKHIGDPGDTFGMNLTRRLREGIAALQVRP